MNRIFYSFCIISAFFCICVLLFTGCSRPETRSKPPAHSRPYKVNGKWYKPIASSRGFTQSGLASWYGKDFHGKKTSNGETYNMYAMTAAHKTLPLGTYVRVYNKQNNREIDVRINDRGPFIRGRIIDLSYTGAKKLGVITAGTAPVKIVALGTPSPAKKKKANEPQAYVPVNYYAGVFTFQVGAFKDRQNAERLRDKLGTSYENAHIAVYDNGEEVFYRVRVGKYDSLEKIEKDERVLIQDGYPDAIIVAE